MATGAASRSAAAPILSRALTALRLALGATPAETVFVGDSPREDILGAQRVGMRAVWVRSREFPLGDVQPDGIIEALPELLPILDRWIA